MEVLISSFNILMEGSSQSIHISAYFSVQFTWQKKKTLHYLAPYNHILVHLHHADGTILAEQRL